ncbi:DUF3078 domain-containing protein, partial [Draconibacterium sp.]|nr:DUF3078 domain-containing protein [Draconibacterium sp.]
ILILFAITHANSQIVEEQKNNETLERGIEILKKYFYEQNNWSVVEPSVEKDVKGIINFIEDEPVDSIISHISKTNALGAKYVYRLPENVEDSLLVPGYYPVFMVEKDLEKIAVELQTEFQNKEIDVPKELTTNLDEKLNLITEDKGMSLFTDSVYTIPDSLQIPEVIPDSLLSSPENFEALRIIDSLRIDFIEQKRVAYNDSLVSLYVDSVANEIRIRQFQTALSYQTKRLNDSVKANNYNVLKAYNDSVSEAVNNSIGAVLETLIAYADFIDTTHISIINLRGESKDIRLQNGNERFTRVWLKNEQKDSLGLLVKNADKRSMQILIDDGVTFSRYKPKDTKNFDFKSLEKEVSDFTKVGKSYEIETPWIIGGDGNLGFSQTYLNNWKKGGQSALSFLMVLKGFANYSGADGKVKWENNAEIRNGWIRPGGKGSETQKNDDKFELTSRYGVSAFKKWYYSAEFNFETQFFKGYQYPREDNTDPISAFMAPSKTYWKIGLEYKPNKDFAMLLSPLTIKNVYVRDTAMVDQTKYGIDKNKKSFWEPGLNADMKFKKQITEDIDYETKYKMFLNYKAPFRKFDVNWENTFNMKLSEYINMRLMLHFIYDDDVLFPVYDDNDVKIDEKAKLQMKEFFSIGFVYKINHKVMKAKRIR